MLADILNTCLARLDAGASVEQCLAAYPQQRAVLEAPLRAAAQLRTLPHPPMPATTRAALEIQMLKLAAARRTGSMPSPTSNGRAPAGWQIWRKLPPSAALAGVLRALGYRGPLALPWLRVALAAIAIVLAVVLGAGALAAARAVIKVFTPPPVTMPTPTAPAVTPFSLDGPIDEIAPAGWIVNGMSITLDSQTTITGTPAVGAVAHISGVLQADGRLLAHSITVDALPPPPTSAPVPTIAPSPIVAPTLAPAPPPPATVPPPPPPPEHHDEDEDEDDD